MLLNNGLLDCVVIEPDRPATACVIWLHGLGADGHDFEPIVPQLGLPASHAVRFVFPHAPQRAVTINGGMMMRAWFDIYGVDIASKQDRTGILDSAQCIEALLGQQFEAGIDAVVLAGFSQGGALALHTGLRYRRALKGILALSCYLPLHSSLAAEAAVENKNAPIFMAHGAQDQVVPQALGEQSRDFLELQGYAVTWRSYPMAHAVCPQEIADIGACICSWLPDKL